MTIDGLPFAASSSYRLFLFDFKRALISSIFKKRSKLKARATSDMGRVSLGEMQTLEKVGITS